MGSILLMGAGLQTTVTGPTYDPDAQLFFNAQSGAGVTLTTTQMNAVNQWVVDAKAANIWTKFKAIYPMVGGSPTSHKFNLKNPLDTNAAFRLAFQGGDTHSSNGYQPNGTNGYADTFLVPSSDLSLNSSHLSFYSRTNSTGSYCDIGSGNNSTSIGYIQLLSKWIDNKFYAEINDNDFSDNTVADSLGLFIGSRTSSTNVKTFKNNSAITNKTTALSTFRPSVSITIGARNLQNGGVTTYSNRQCAFASIGDGLTDLESQLFYQITEKYQVALSRNVNALQSFYYNSAYNNETNAFLFSTQITDNTIQTATNTLVTDLKTAGVFTKMKAIYPMVGGTATTHKFNLANAQDSTTAFALSFVGGWTHSANGALPNGTNAYADTFLTPSTALTLNSTHLSYYSRTNITTDIYTIGSYDNTNSLTMYANYAGNNYSDQYNGTNGRLLSAVARGDGLFIGNRTASNVHNNWRNTTKLGTSTVSTALGSLPTFKILLAAIQPTFVNGAKQCAFASIGDGLSDAEALAFYNAVNAFQVTLGRNV